MLLFQVGIANDVRSIFQTTPSFTQEILDLIFIVSFDRPVLFRSEFGKQFFHGPVIFSSLKL